VDYHPQSCVRLPLTDEERKITARGRYEDLRALVGDAQALQTSLMERLDAAQEEFRRLQVRLGRASLPGGDPDEVEKLEADLAAVSAKLDRLERERSRLRANTEQVVSRLDNFILQLFSSTGAVTEPPRITVEPRLRDGESATDAILRLRKEINRTRAEIATLRAAPLPAAEIKDTIIDRVYQMAAEGQPQVSIEGTKVVVHWPDVQQFSVPGQALTAPSGGASKLLCWLDRGSPPASRTPPELFQVVSAPGAFETSSSTSSRSRSRRNISSRRRSLPVGVRFSFGRRGGLRFLPRDNGAAGNHGRSGPVGACPYNNPDSPRPSSPILRGVAGSRSLARGRPVYLRWGGDMPDPVSRLQLALHAGDPLTGACSRRYRFAAHLRGSRPWLDLRRRQACQPRIRAATRRPRACACRTSPP
jgi:hypothetical protein